VIDFDAVLRDPEHPSRLLPRFASEDHLHPNDAGYQAMADAIDVTFFQSNKVAWVALLDCRKEKRRQAAALQREGHPSLGVRLTITEAPPYVFCKCPLGPAARLE
jgi:hypothetical protein